MSEPTPRQVLYALVAGGFLFVVAILTMGAAMAGLVPVWWSVSLGATIVVAAVYLAVRWRRTGPILLVAIGLFLVWMIGTLALIS